ncbi:DUF421 domain-containing protein [Noviherbaspirillum sp. ST9]|uniref:DUF421 domain-containing protein n=1 Tax=Noviherbaspirillum sp. ST9 TaxID=3401606 RepID=UPI003B587E85
MFFDSWDSLVRIVLTGIFAYAGTVFLLRISGNRTLSKINSFDLVVTIAFGSTLATILTNSSVSLAEGLLAIAVLVSLQFVLTWLSVRSRAFGRIIKTQPTLLFKDGEFLVEAMRRVRVTQEEIRAVICQQGIGSTGQVAAVILETDGSLSIVSKNQEGNLDVLQGVRGHEEP